ncbi:polysaccharide ABC transporter ATP-binding protein [uncultured Desulfosarcina sp.]|uniref:ABC transporter ATP-binding protein n=1 Tax=uncultured Desulfosarcina sp. TaxID=218289 RepID=UPI0029C6F0E6|nr:polysaccharide ABC transporter ATP-binding protein [uncultured Desulfosarcina sp.]
MNADTLIKVEGLSKKFCRDLKKSLWYGMKDLGREILGRPHGGKGGLRSDEFWAVNDVSFELKRGECLGLIGRNGAGKTTLLRMLNGLIKLDRGRIEMRGRLGALIALGAGFNPILTGLENIYINAAILGLRKSQVDSKLDDIIDFSELGEFIDMPVQSYSSGMSVRLGFSVAAILIQPDILFLDEVLAVGDIGFTIKCLNAVRGLSQHSAVVFVSHNMQYISDFCTRVMVLNRGKVILDAANPADGIDCYYSLMDQRFKVSGTGEAEILDINLLTKDRPAAVSESPQNAEIVIAQGTDATVQLAINVDRKNTKVALTLCIMDEAMTPVLGVPVCANDGTHAQIVGPKIRLDIPLGAIELNSGKYSLMVAVSDAQTKELLLRVQGLIPFRVFAVRSYWAKFVRPACLVADMPPNRVQSDKSLNQAENGTTSDI